MYVFVRKNLSPAQICVQSAHAVIESARHFLEPDEQHPSVILFGVKSEAKLRSIAEQLQQQGIRLKQFFEPDIGNQLTAFATAPVFGKDRELFAKYCLLR